MSSEDIEPPPSDSEDPPPSDCEEPPPSDNEEPAPSETEEPAPSDSEEPLDEPSSELGEDQNESATDMSMFASVWVKVEVEEDDNSMSEVDVPRFSKRKRRVPQKIQKSLKCDACDYTTNYKNCLQLHILGHTNFKPFACEVCPYVTRYPTSLHRHMLTQHEYKNSEKEKDLPLHSCDKCAYTSYYKWNLNAHKRKHNLEKEFKCEQCSYKTAYRHNYIKHSKVHNKTESLYKCDKCPFVTKFEGHISRHLAKIHNEVSDKANKCDFCDFSTKVRWRLNIHKSRSRQKDILKCIYCDFETYYMCESKKHKVTHYSEIYTNKREAHSQETVSETHPDVPDYNAPSIDPANQTIHEKNNHYTIDPVCEIDWNNIQVSESSNKDKPFQCIMCKYTARFKASVQRHFQRHHTSQNRPYKCLNCDFSTKTKDQIALHNKRSQSEIEMFCRSCNFSTFFKCQYVMHQKCHYEHKCSACDYTCRTKYDITKHYSTVHLGNGLKCRFCDYKASRAESLLCHETIHTGNKPFKCSYCDYMSVRKSLLLNHVKRYHSEVQTDPVVIDDSKIESLKISPSELIQNETLREFFASQGNISMVANDPS